MAVASSRASETADNTSGWFVPAVWAYIPSNSTWWKGWRVWKHTPMLVDWLARSERALSSRT